MTWVMILAKAPRFGHDMVIYVGVITLLETLLWVSSVSGFQVKTLARLRTRRR
jgi:hypothetical protein